MRKVDHLREGQLVEGRSPLDQVRRLCKPGRGPEGLIHISELSEQRIAHPKEVVKEGDDVTLRVSRSTERAASSEPAKGGFTAYADLDWKMALAEEVKEVQETDSPMRQDYMRSPSS